MYVNPLKLQSGPAFQGRGDGPRDEKGGLKRFLSSIDSCAAPESMDMLWTC
jgi:hypothetical protein